MKTINIDGKNEIPIIKNFEEISKQDLEYFNSENLINNIQKKTNCDLKEAFEIAYSVASIALYLATKGSIYEVKEFSEASDTWKSIIREVLNSYFPSKSD